MNRIDNPDRLNTLQRVGQQFAMVPWWAKPLLAAVYVAALVGLVVFVRWIAPAGIYDNPIGKLVTFLLGH